MKKIFIVAISCIFFLFQSAYAESMEKHVKESKGMIKDLMGSLKKELKSAMMTGGPVKAISVCNTKATVIAKEKSEKYNASVARTSLKTRNTINNPDAWELKVLQKFEERKKSGENPAKIDHSEIVSENGKKVFRYMKAIPTGKICLNCHGKSVKKPIASKIMELYPKDRAMGFSVGDIRGAFTITKKLN